MALKDKLAILFSSFALLMTLLNFYFANLRVDSRLLVRVMDITTHLPLGGLTDSIETTLTIANPGNREAMILTASYQLHPSYLPHDSVVFSQSVDRYDTLLPMIVDPRQLKLLKLTMPMKRLIEEFQGGSIQRRDSLWLYMEFQSMDASGDIHLVDALCAKIRLVDGSVDVRGEPNIAPIELLPKTRSFMRQ